MSPQDAAHRARRTPPDSGSTASAPATPLTGAQRRTLRGLVANERPVVWIGEAGLSAGALRSVDEALDGRELIKVRLRSPADKRGTARELAARSGSELCGVIGHTVILYRPHPDPERRRIALPAPRGESGA